MITEAKSTENNDEAFEFEDAVSKTGFGWYNIQLLLVCGISLMSVIIETMSMSFIIPAAKCELELTLNDKGILSSIGFLGVVLSAIMWGFLGDTIGRKKMLITSSYISFIVGVISSFAPYVNILILLRFINSFFIGGAAIVITYLGEFHSSNYRAKVIALSASFVGGATILMTALAWLVLPMTWELPIPFLNLTYRPWRMLIVLYDLPTFISASWMLFFPESPKYLWAMNKEKEALDIISHIYVKNTGNELQSFPVKKLVTPNELPNSKQKTPVNFKNTNIIIGFFKLIRNQIIPIFLPPLLLNTILVSFLLFGVFASSSGYLMWMPEILNRVSTYSENTNTSSVTACEAWQYSNSFTNTTELESLDTCIDSFNIEVFQITMLVSIAFTATYILIGILINYTGKKYLLVGLLGITGTAGVIIHFMNTYILISVLSGLFIVGGTGVTILNTVVVDLFPTQYRSIAMAVSLMIGRIGAMTASHIIGYILEFTCSALFFLLGGLYLLLALVALFLPVR